MSDDDDALRRPDNPRWAQMEGLILKANMLNYDGHADEAYAVLTEARRLAEGSSVLAEERLYTVIAYQGIAALRRGETDNCVLCRGESSCILPIAPAAVHTKPTGSRLAVEHFTEYLTRFPDDLDFRWLLNVAHMTLGEYPDRVDPRFRLSLDRYLSAEHGIGKFRDVGHLAGVNRFNQSGGAILDDFDGDDRLDVVLTSYDPTAPMAFYRNKGDGTFEDRTREAGLGDQLGGLYCVQADYNNDGFPDVFVPRGAWYKTPMRPSLLRNNGNGTFTDVTREAGLLGAMNAITAQWADYDNDGFLDLFVCGEAQPNRLYRNNGDGTFEEVSEKAGVDAPGGTWKGMSWIDFDGDRFPDLFLNDLNGPSRLYRNNRNGTFTDVTREAGIDGPPRGFSCWAFDYDNDGRPDIFAAGFVKDLAPVVRGLLGESPDRPSNRLYRNLGGGKFQDVSQDAGLGVAFAAMGSNFADFDNDGFLDFYLGTGTPDFGMLVPNRLFRNLSGRRFADISGSSGTGHLQKGHAVACGDWRRGGAVDILIEMGGAVDGDRYHTVLFQNPGQGNNWLNVKLVGSKTNRSAIGARVKVVTAGDNPRTVYRWVSSGSSFGANPLEQHIGLGKADRVAEVEVYWPTSDTTQVFRDLPANQGIEITEFATAYRKRGYQPVPPPR
ncbi:MAG: CRTAC1 family protein [Gemmataceae bacterium]